MDFEKNPYWMFLNSDNTHQYICIYYSKGRQKFAHQYILNKSFYYYTNRFLPIFITY